MSHFKKNKKSHWLQTIDYLGLNYWDIDEVTPKSQIDFFDKTCRSKTEKVTPPLNSVYST